MRRSSSKQLILFLIGCAANIVLFCLSKYLHFPLWLDFTGSFYITAVCGPLPGVISFLLHITLLAVLIDGAGALWLALPMLFAGAVVYAAKHFSLLGKPLYHVCTVFSKLTCRVCGILHYFHFKSAACAIRIIQECD